MMKKEVSLCIVLTCTIASILGVTEDKKQGDIEGYHEEVQSISHTTEKYTFNNNSPSDDYGNIEKKIRYNGYKVYNLIPRNKTQINALEELQKDPKGLDFWTFTFEEGHSVEIMASNETYPVLKAFVKKYGFEWNVQIPNVQKLIDAQLPPNGSESFSWFYFYDLDAMNAWVDYISAYYTSILTPLIIGHSYEGRPIRGVKLSHKPGNPGVFIESGIHAREWIAPVTALWILNVLLTSQSSEINYYAENYDWYIFPCVNPDGYQYSYKYDRFWRKTRSPVSETCKGVDANRNWNFHWSGGGDPCSTTYPGPNPFSEPETKILANYMRSIADKIQVYLDFHSFSQLLMFPYSYTKMHAPNYDELMRIANKSAEALESIYGTHYTVGDVASTVYPANGSSLDWMYGFLNISLCYAFELRDRGETGVLLPPKQIIPTGSETMIAIITILKEGRDIALREYYEKNNHLNSFVETFP